MNIDNSGAPAESAPTRRISRRAVTTTAAWTVPAVALAVATPAAATSGHHGSKPVVSPADGTKISTWKGDHHYGSDNSNSSRRSYEFPVFVTDQAGSPINDAVVTVVAAGANRDGDILGVYAYPAPSNGGPESHPSKTASLSAGTAGRYLFAVNTQNLSSHERPAAATLTITATTSAGSTTSTVKVFITETD